MKGKFIEFKAKANTDEAIFFVDKCNNIDSFTACYRYVSCWMTPQFGKDISSLKMETQFLITKKDLVYTVIIPLVIGNVRCSLFGDKDGLKVLCETGAKETTFSSVTAIYTISGEDFYEIIETAFSEIRSKIDTFELVDKKVVPKFVDYLGYCTYNAFYQDISQEKLEGVLKRFNDENIGLGYMLIDAGWQDQKERRVMGYDADKIKFPDGLKKSIEKLKSYGLDQIILWHAFTGFWKGFDKDKFKKFNVEESEYLIPEKFKKSTVEEGDNVATVGQNFYPPASSDAPLHFNIKKIKDIYEDYYRHMASCGADGSKVDAMAWVEALGHKVGGRINAMKLLCEAIKESNVKYMNSELINCSSNSNDYYFYSKDTTVTRTSCDYFPDIEKSHGNHVLMNLHVATCFSSLVLPDWDMFQSGNTAGKYHAMSKAISGGPICMTDTPGKERFDIIKKLATAKGFVPRCTAPLKLCTDSIFTDVKQLAPIKSFTKNKYSYILGLFNCSNSVSNDGKVVGEFSLSDVDKLPKGEYVLYSEKRGFIGKMDDSYKEEITLDKLQADIYTIVPITNGIAVIGDTSKYNPNAFIKEQSIVDDNLKIEMYENANVLVYSEKQIDAQCVGKNLYRASGEKITLKI